MNNLPESQYDYRHENQQAKRMYTCTNCEGGIYLGDAYWDINGQIICEGCMEHMKLEVEVEE